MIDENTLAKWLNKNIQTLRDWRCKGKGPKFVKDSRTVNYRVGTVLEWIHSREVKSTSQADTLSTEIHPSEQPLISYSNWDDDSVDRPKNIINLAW